MTPDRGPLAILIGPMGVGKTTAGAQLAALHSVDFMDSDHAVEEAAGRTVAELFAERGEAAFRELEANTIAQLLNSFTGVLALGGGAITTARVRELLKGQRVIRLTVSPQAVASRLHGGRGRPLLEDAPDPIAAWQSIADQREPLFADVALSTITTDDATPAEVARRISAAISHREASQSPEPPPSEETA